MINRNKKAKKNETFENRSWVKGNVLNGLAQLSLIKQRRFNMKLLQRYSLILLATVFLIASAGLAGASNFPGPDEFGYTGVEIPTTLRDISSTGLNPDVSNDAMSVPIDIGFTFNYYGNPYSEFQISPNGFITLGSGLYEPFAEAMPIPTLEPPNNFIAGYWSDLNPEYGGVIRYQTVGSEPNRELIVGFYNVRYNNPWQIMEVTFEIILHEVRSYCQELCMEKLGGDPFFFNSIDKVYSPDYFC